MNDLNRNMEARFSEFDLKNLAGPIQVSFTVTRRCNFLCRHCYNCSGSDIKDDMSDEMLLDVTDQICSIKPSSVCICGGEPLLRGEIMYTIIKKLSKSISSVNIVSNGYLITSEVAKRLKTSGINTLQISLDGNTPFLHNNIRMNSKAFDRAVSAIKYGVEYGMNVAVSCCPSKLNISKIDEMAQFVKALGAVELRLMPLITMGRGVQMDKLKPSADEYLVLQQRIHKINSMYSGSGFSVKWGDPLDHLYRMPMNYKNNMNAYTMEITSNGKLSVTTYLPIIVGDLRCHTLKEYWESGYKDIWGNESVLKLIRDFYSTSQFATFKPTPYSGEEVQIMIPIGVTK